MDLIKIYRESVEVVTGKPWNEHFAVFGLKPHYNDGFVYRGFEEKDSAITKWSYIRRDDRVCALIEKGLEKFITEKSVWSIAVGEGSYSVAIATQVNGKLVTLMEEPTKIEALLAAAKVISEITKNE